MVHIVGSTSGPHHFALQKQWFSEDFCEPNFRGGCRVFVAFWCLGPKQAFRKGDGSHPLFNFLFWWLLVDVTTKKPYKIRSFCHPLLERRKGEKRRERPEVKKTPPFLQCFFGLKNGQEVVPPFWAPKFQFFKIC